jgi:hypothetical protein
MIVLDAKVGGQAKFTFHCSHFACCSHRITVSHLAGMISFFALLLWYFGVTESALSSTDTKMIELTLWMAISTFALAIFGLFQTIATREAAKAAQLTAKLFMDSQKAQIAGSAHGDPKETLSDSHAPRVEIELLNRGLTPAYNFTYESWIEVLPLPFENFTELADHFSSPEPLTLYPNHDPLVINIPIRGGLTEVQRASIRALKLQVCIRVLARFRDAFGSARTSNFGYIVHPRGLGFLPKYNDAN